MNGKKINKGDSLYSNYVITVVVIFLVSMAAVYFWKQGKSDLDVTGIWAAGLINVLNSLIGFKVILNSLGQKSTQKFFIASLGSMTVRLLASNDI
jgi:hypothetical protein